MLWQLRRHECPLPIMEPDMSKTDDQPEIAASDRRSVHLAATGGDWEDAGKPGVRVNRLHTDASRGERTLLFELEPGARSAPHSHDDFEQLFVLSGSFHDGERLLRAGDYCSRAPGEVHEATTEEGARVLVIYTPA
jgi:quercetin dioxygenase-like cupin family protein